MGRLPECRVFPHTFDFDDAHAASILHPGATAIPAVLAQAELSESDGRTFLLAVAWLFGTDVGWAMYAKLGDPDVAAWCRKVRAVVARDVRDLEARVTFNFADGTSRREVLVHPLGEDEHPFPRARVHGKFLGMTKSCYPEATQKSILTTVERLDSVRVAELVRLL